MREALTATELELNQMLDEGVRVELVPTDRASIEIRVLLEDASCADCLVPDDTLIAIAQDAVGRHGGDSDARFTVQHTG